MACRCCGSGIHAAMLETALHKKERRSAPVGAADRLESVDVLADPQYVHKSHQAACNLRRPRAARLDEEIPAVCW